MSINVNEVMSDEYVERCLTEARYQEANGESRAARIIEGLMAKIDTLMLEFCPGDMSPRQLENWKDKQVAYETFKDEKFESWLKRQHYL